MFIKNFVICICISAFYLQPYEVRRQNASDER